MKLENVLSNVEYQYLSVGEQGEITGINVDSRLIKNGNIFVAIDGYADDGHKYIDSAIQNGATVILVNKNKMIESDKRITIIAVENTREVLPVIVNNFYNWPTKNFKLIGVTGTNGKTSITTMIKHIYRDLNKKTGLIGTINNYINEDIVDVEKNTPTTPNCIELGRIFDEFVKANVETAFMEVSSMALKFRRVDGCDFDIVVFSNISPEHLDNHKTMEDYIQSKMRLFSMGKKAVINADDEIYERVYKLCPSNVIRYGIKNIENCDLYADKIEYFEDSVMFEIHYKDISEKVEVSIPSEFAIYNTLAVIGVCIMDNVNISSAVKSLNQKIEIAGRFERLKVNVDFSIIVDYAHTPAALENLLKSVKSNKAFERVITVFGCGGDRDDSKRSVMGNISQDNSDFTVITSDNPRTESEMEIINDILEGIDKNKENYHVEPDRRKAISFALKFAKKGDVVVIAGKGHESEQLLNGYKIEFNDKKVALEELKKLKGELDD